MEKQISQWISEAEEKWLEILQSNAAETFSGTFLPSHDQDHHLRVWNFSKVLLQEIASLTSSITPGLVEGVMIASWFHDLGLVQSMKESHGALGKEMCAQFFHEEGRSLPSQFGEITGAIENHDSKEASIYDAFLPGSTPGILNILSIADDMDALGVIGIYRYAEIYLHRKVPIRELGIHILRNASLRFRNIYRSLSNCPSLADYSGKQFDTLLKFFNLYNQQMAAVKEPETVFWGHVGVVNHIRKFSTDRLVRPEAYLDVLDFPVAGKTVTTYFKKLKNELEKENEH